MEGWGVGGEGGAKERKKGKEMEVEKKMERLPT